MWKSFCIQGRLHYTLEWREDLTGDAKLPRSSVSRDGGPSTMLSPRSGAGCGGLPFYRLAMESPRTCAEFCLSKSLDLSIVLDAAQCRCGASAKHPSRWQCELCEDDQCSFGTGPW
ncbi:unnamed protein product [Durusdinium trenchii]|uniref:Uncharacterized protein n=1 Tax=Durusdinium trenchii TaxID=1381693 RepID=A0ABP0NJ10_9DINO